MIRTLKASMVRGIAGELNEFWEAHRKEIKLSGKNLYNLIGLKKLIVEKGSALQDTVIQHAEALGGEWTADGQMRIPPEHIEVMNEWIQEFMNEDIDIDYQEIVVTSEDAVPIPILEALYEFISVE